MKTMKRRKFSWGMLGGVASLILILLLAVAMLPAAPVSANSSVDIGISPVSVMVGVNEIFSVDIVLTAGTQPVFGASAHIDFNTTYLEVQSIDEGATLQTVNDKWIAPQFNNTAGTIDCIWARAGAVEGLPSGNFTLATVHLKALAETSSTSLSFVFEPPIRNTDILDYDLNSIIGGHSDGEVATIVATINGQVTFQRPQAPSGGPSWVQSLDLTVLAQGSATIVETYTVNTNETGAFTCVLTGLPLGTYDIGVKGNHTLSRITENVTIGGATNEVSFDTLLEGDASGDDAVADLDFFMLVLAYNSLPGDANWDVRCDFDCNGAVSDMDFFMLVSNFMQTGEIYDRLNP